MYDDDLLNAIAIVSFIVGVANYNENLTQSDKDDIMKTLDQQTKEILIKIEGELEKQNEMLREILRKVKEK